jgi:hypothetical protein
MAPKAIAEIVGVVLTDRNAKRCLMPSVPNAEPPAKCLSNQMAEKKFFAVNVLGK